MGSGGLEMVPLPRLMGPVVRRSRMPAMVSKSEAPPGSGLVMVPPE